MQTAHFGKLINQRKHLLQRHILACVFLSVRNIAMYATLITAAGEFELKAIHARLALRGFQNMVLRALLDRYFRHLREIINPGLGILHAVRKIKVFCIKFLRCLTDHDKEIFVQILNKCHEILLEFVMRYAISVNLLQLVDNIFYILWLTVDGMQKIRSCFVVGAIMACHLIGDVSFIFNEANKSVLALAN